MANYVINSQQFRGQPILKKLKFVIFGLEKANLATLMNLSEMVKREPCQTGLPQNNWKNNPIQTQKQLIDEVPIRQPNP